MPQDRIRLARRGLCALFLTAALLVAGAGQPSAASTESELQAARSRLGEYTSYFNSVAAQAQGARDGLASIQRRFDAVELEVRRTAQSMLTNEETAVSWARELYMGGSTQALEGLLGSKSLSEVDAQLTYLQFSGRRQRVLFEELATKGDLLDRRLEQLEEERAAAAAIVADLNRLQAEMGSRLAELNAEVADLGSELQAEIAAAQQAALGAQSSSVAPSGAAVPGPPYHADWDAIAMCESGGNWHLDSTYDGGLQFHPMTWLGAGGGKYAEYAWQATREQQIAIGEAVLASQGPGAWPNCYKEL